MTIILAQVAVAVLEFFLLNWLGQHSLSAGYRTPNVIQDYEEKPLFNVVFRVLGPVIFLVITATLWFAVGAEELVRSYWRVTLFYFLFRWLFNVSLGRAALLRWGNQLLIGALSTLLSFYTYQQFLQNRSAVLPSARALADELWLIVILFIYTTYNHLEIARSGAGSERRRNRYVLSQFDRLKVRYGTTVDTAAPSPLLEALAYAVMIYENFNRPPLYQWIERWVLFPIGRSRSLGPMQIQAAEPIDALESVRRGVRKLATDYEAAVVRLIAANDGYSDAALTTISRHDVTSLKYLRGMPPYWRWNVLEQTLTSYNIRSDYSEAVLSVFRLLLAEKFTEVNTAIYDYGTEGEVIADA
jgi:hypothetical protein